MAAALLYWLSRNGERGRQGGRKPDTDSQEEGEKDGVGDRGAKKQLDIYLQENWISSVGRKHTDFWTEDIYMTFLLGIF